jgi:hypothetical protein
VLVWRRKQCLDLYVIYYICNWWWYMLTRNKLDLIWFDLIVAFWPGTVELGIILIFFFCRRLVLNIFLFPVSTAKLFGDFYNNRQSAANSYPYFAYSFVFLMLRQYYWRCDSYSANRRSAANIKKICENFILALRIRLASPIGAASVPPLRLFAPNATQRQ